MFRAPGFSANERTLDILEELGYRLDSSVLPGGLIRMFKGRLTIRSFERVPRAPYHPSKKDLTVAGGRAILEVPVTENPDFPGAPLGLGYLQTFGVDLTRRAVEKVRGPYLTFLIHSWEATDLGARFPFLPEHVKRECSGDLEPLRSILGGLKDRWPLDSLVSLLPT